MGKIISAYRGFTAQAIKDKADIPAQGNMSVSGSNVDCTNITTAAVNTGLGTSGVNTVGGLCTHANVNHWSGFGPTIRTVSNQTLVNSDPVNNYSEGSFAGYNHTAVAPGWITSAPSADIWVDAGSSPSFLVDVYVGEVKWHEVANGISGLTLAMYYPEGGLYAWGSTNFINDSIQNSVTSLTAVGPPTIERTYTGKLWLVDYTTEFDGSQIVCRLPNTADFTQTVKIKAASVAYYDATGTNQPPSPWVNNNGGLGMNWTTGYCTIGYDIQANATYTNIRVKATLFNWLWEVIGTADIYNGAYNPFDSIYGSVYLGMTNIPAYGYRVRVDIEESY